MDRIKDPTATADDKFQEASGATPATRLRAPWLNGVQEELLHIIEEEGLLPSGADLTQVLAALDRRFPRWRNAVTKVANITELRALTGAVEGQVVELVSYNPGWAATLRGPIGGGRLTADTTDVSTADNGVTVFVDEDGTRWKRPISDGLVNIEWSGGADQNALIATFKAAVDLQSSYVFNSQYNTGVPTIYLPTGRYSFDTSDGTLISAAAYGAGFPDRIAGIHLKGDGAFQTIIELTGTNWLWDVQNDMQWTTMEGMLVVGQNGTERLFNFYSTGGAKHPRFEDVWTENVADVVWTSGAGNADHLRMLNCHLSEIPSGGVAININNVQSVAHVLQGTNIHNIHGKGIQNLAGGPLDMFGGSVTVADGGRFLHVEGGSSDIGLLNGAMNFYGIKPEVRNLAGGAAPDFAYIDAACRVNFIGGIYAQDGRDDDTADMITVKRGSLHMNNLTWGDTWFIRNDGSFTGSHLNARPGDIHFDDCELRAELADIVRLDASTPDAATAHAIATNCYGVDENPVDVAINGYYPKGRYPTPLKRGIFRNGSALGGGLPSTSFTFTLPKGATVTKVGVAHQSSGTAGTDYQYEVTDGNAVVIHTTAALANTDNVVDDSGEIVLAPQDAASQVWTCTAVGTDTAVQKGWVFVEWI